MKAFTVPETGEVLYPVALYDGDSLGDGYALALAESAEGKRWARWAQPLPDRLRPVLERLRAARLAG